MILYYLVFTFSCDCVRCFYFFFQLSVCPGGTQVSALSQDPRTFQNTGTWRQQTPAVSVIYRPFTTRSHTHTQTHLKKHHIWVHMKALLLTVEDEKFTWKNAARAPTKKKKMRSGKCVHTEIRYENAYRGGRNSFDLIRMVKKNNGWQRKIKGAGAE